MPICIKLYGTLGQYVEGYDHIKGISMTIESRASVADLIAQLGIPAEGVGIVTINAKLSKAGDKLLANSQVKIFQPISGG